MIIFGYILAVLMGTTLGLIGAGGSILTVPILVYFFKIPPLLATAYSLLIVGSTALIGALSYYRKNLVDIRSALIFIIPAMTSVLITRAFIIPNLPEELVNIPKEIFIMLLFASLMLATAFLMLRPPILSATNMFKKKSKFTFLKLTLGSSAIGFLTGMVGAGGGFLIIPTLVMLFGLSMKQSIGTSLAIIATNSLVGFGGDLFSGIKINWSILALFISLTSLGMIFGIWLSKNLDGQKLKKVFSLFILMVAIAIFIQEIHQLLTISKL
jgi:uncharacterized membrane protein YfcA